MSRRVALALLAAALVWGSAIAANPGAAAYTAAMQGRKAAALGEVQRLVPAPGSSGWELSPQYAVLVRFGLWDELIALERPSSHGDGVTAAWLYGRGVALAARGRIPEARAALKELGQLGDAIAPDIRAGANTLRAVIAVAAPVVAARIAASEYRLNDAAAALGQAVAAEDRLAAADPPDWFFPVRDLLGAQLLLAGRAADAERVYREDLVRNPGSGWALYGLAAAVRDEGKPKDAAAIARTFTAAWRSADVHLLASAFWFGGPDNTRCECEREQAAVR